MRTLDHVTEVFLQPGDFHFGDEHTRIRTLLGSCVSIALWHPTRRIGGMCHYMLPSRERGRADKLDGRYADEAMELFFQAIDKAGTRPADYQVKVFGGGKMFPIIMKDASCGPAACNTRIATCRNIACKNVVTARTLLQGHGMRIAAEHLGGDSHRQIVFDLWSGHVWMKQTPAPHATKP
ncbi:MAG: chemotaxis protein CheD [Pseudomonadota bacterium]